MFCKKYYLCVFFSIDSQIEFGQFFAYNKNKSLAFVHFWSIVIQVYWIHALVVIHVQSISFICCIILFWRLDRNFSSKHFDIFQLRSRFCQRITYNPIFSTIKNKYYFFISWSYIYFMMIVSFSNILFSCWLTFLSAQSSFSLNFILSMLP